MLDRKEKVSLFVNKFLVNVSTSLESIIPVLPIHKGDFKETDITFGGHEITAV